MEKIIAASEVAASAGTDIEPTRAILIALVRLGFLKGYVIQELARTPDEVPDRYIVFAERSA